MAQGKRTTVAMHFGDGSTIEEWVSFSLRDTYTDPLADYQLVCRPSRANILRYRKLLKKGEIVTFFVNGVNQGGFVIQTVDTKISPEQGVIFTISCNTPLIAAYQGGANPDFTFKSKTEAPVTDFILRVLHDYGFQDVIGDSRLNINAITGKAIPGGQGETVRVDALKHNEATVQDGETAYALCARILTRLGGCLRFTADNQVLVVSKPDYDQEPAYQLVQSADLTVEGDRFDGDIDLHETNDNQFSECRVRGQRNDTPGSTSTARPDATVKASDVVNRLAAYSSLGQAYKPLIIRDKSCTSPERAKSVAKLALGGRAKDAFSVSGGVGGLVSQTGRVWTVNTIAEVRIDVINFRAPLWIIERTLTQDAEGGQRTRLRAIPKGALILGDLPGSG